MVVVLEGTAAAATKTAAGDRSGSSSKSANATTPATPAPKKNSPCAYAVFYAEGSSTTGRVISDVLHVPLPASGRAVEAGGAGGASNGSNGASTSSSSSSSSANYYSPRVQFGCADTEDGMLRTQAADGILGLGNSADTVVGQLAGSGATAGAGFGVCLSHPSGGAVLLGAGADDTAALARAVGVTGEMKYVPLLRDRHFAVAGGKMLLGGKEIPVTAKPPPPGSEAAKKRRAELLGPKLAASLSPAAQAIEDSALADEVALWDSYYDAGAPKKDGEPLSLGRTVVDSGATWSYLPFGKAIALERALQRVVDMRPMEQAPRLRRLPPDFLPEELCWRAQPEDTPPAAVYSAFPKLTLELSDKPGGLAIELAPEAYLYPLYEVEVPPESAEEAEMGAAKAAKAANGGGGGNATTAAAGASDAADDDDDAPPPPQRNGKDDHSWTSSSSAASSWNASGGMRGASTAAVQQQQQPAGGSSSGNKGRRRLHSATPPATPSPSLSFTTAPSRRLTMGDIAAQEVKGVYCLGFMRSAEEWSLLGGAALRGRLTHFDLTRQRLGLATATCRIDPVAVSNIGARARRESSGPLANESGVKEAAAAGPQASSGGGRRLLSASAYASGAAVATFVARAAA